MLPRYPYKVAHDLALFLYPALLDNEENLFALCDVSLMHNMPGWAFFQLLNEMTAQKFIPLTGKDIIDFGYTFYDQKGWNYQGYMTKADESLQNISSQLYPTNVLSQP